MSSVMCSVCSNGAKKRANRTGHGVETVIYHFVRSFISHTDDAYIYQSLRKKLGSAFNPPGAVNTQTPGAVGSRATAPGEQ